MRDFLIGTPYGDVWTHSVRPCRKRVRRWVVLAFLLGLAVGFLGCAAKKQTACEAQVVCEEWWPCPPCPAPYQVHLLGAGPSPTVKGEWI